VPCPFFITFFVTSCFNNDKKASPLEKVDSQVSVKVNCEQFCQGSIAVLGNHNGKLVT